MAEWKASGYGGGGGGGAPSVANFDSARRASGDITLNSTSWANLDNGLDCVVTAATGNVLLVSLAGFYGSEATNGYLDAVTSVSGTPTRSVARAAAVEASPGTTGVQAWSGAASAFESVSGVIPYTVDAGDIVTGQVTIRFRYATSAAANKTLRASSTQPLAVWVWNIGTPL